MWKKSKQFFKLVGYETKRVMRNKVVFAMLIGFSVILLLALYFIQLNVTKYPIAIYTDGINLEEAGVVKLINENLGASNIVYVDSEEEGVDMVKYQTVCFFIRFVKGEEKDQPVAFFYFDQAHPVASAVADGLNYHRNEYTYATINQFLQKYGITLNKTYFESILFRTIGSETIPYAQRPFPLEVAFCAAIILMLGLAYSLARDNETQISKNVAYIPVGVNRYLFSKIVPFFILGMLEITVMYLIGMFAFGINFQINIIWVILLSSLFILATIMLGLIFSLFKSQIATIFLDMMFVILPIFVSSVVYVPACPIFIQILLYAIPVTSFISFFSGMIFSGVVIWWYIPIFIAQIVIFYLLSLMIMKRRVQE